MSLTISVTICALSSEALSIIRSAIRVKGYRYYHEQAGIAPPLLFLSMMPDSSVADNQHMVVDFNPCIHE